MAASRPDTPQRPTTTSASASESGRAPSRSFFSPGPPIMFIMLSYGGIRGRARRVGVCDTAPPVWHGNVVEQGPGRHMPAFCFALEPKELTEASDRPLVRAGGCRRPVAGCSSRGGGSVALGPRQGLSRAPVELRDPARTAMRIQVDWRRADGRRLRQSPWPRGPRSLSAGCPVLSLGRVKKGIASDGGIG